MAIESKWKLDETELDAEFASAKKKRSDGPGLRDMIFEQKDLPQGSITMRFLPPAGEMRMPWFRWDEHGFFNESNKGAAFFTCLGDGCPGCEYQQRLWRLHSKLEPLVKAGKAKMPFGLVKMKDARAKAKLASHVLITSWNDKEVPEEHQGLRIFKYGPAIWKGTDRNQILGLMKLLRDYNDLVDPMMGVDIRITKSGKDLDTSYVVEMVQAPAPTKIGNKVIQMMAPKVGPVAGLSEPEIEELLSKCRDLSFFGRTKSPDEIVTMLSKVDTFQDVAEPAAAPARGRTAQRDMLNAVERDLQGQKRIGDPEAMGVNPDDDISF